MFTIQLNGTTETHPAGTTVADLVTATTGRALLSSGQAADGGRLGVAVARNSGIVPRSQWSATAVEHEDELEIVTAVQGG
ncbi:sulfur carrier protein ThiS [Arthrobacter psychrochitiniphilus]|uniref:Thiamine biosynthesis protein ThiS n=1 Tax=Arthrobacter psychrochitiniphilus TaxID=291045 RepID=A0A2V3DPS7_9MICC|nr:sulfur carrier protein ThiS [Arthrobacter psychrochitiniphilus]NYG18464.1 sulfur carrier protein [Arthrobacter psychrochitiniphilus]PXA64509.1 thiamine biosynthesis protein ThiS [Arthrobacter psychrochitiniphilus]